MTDEFANCYMLPPAHLVVELCQRQTGKQWLSVTQINTNELAVQVSGFVHKYEINNTSYIEINHPPLQHVSSSY